MRRCSALLIVFALFANALLGAIPAGAASSPHHSDPLVSPATETLCYQMLQLLNVDRVNAGVAPLALDRRLTSVATSHSDDMARRHYFAHSASDGDNPFRRLDHGGIPCNRPSPSSTRV